MNAFEEAKQGWIATVVTAQNQRIVLQKRETGAGILQNIATGQVWFLSRLSLALTPFSDTFLLIQWVDAVAARRSRRAARVDGRRA